MSNILEIIYILRAIQTLPKMQINVNDENDTSDKEFPSQEVKFECEECVNK